MLALTILLAGPAPAGAASCNGASHTPALSNGTVSPGSGTTSTNFAFSVTYRDSGGCAPSSVVTVVSGIGTLAMSASGSNWKAGVTFSARLVRV